MKVYLINLDKDRERYAVADARLKELGIPYERVSAVYARELPLEEQERAVDSFRWWCAVGRPARLGEIGCAMSHYLIYRQTTEPICILEDDVVLDDRFPEMLSYVERHIDVSRPQVILLSNHTGRASEIPIVPSLQRARRDMRTEGYVITPLAARALLKVNWPLKTPCDHWGRWVRHGVIELYHAFPTVCRQNWAQFDSETVDKGCYQVSKLSGVRFCAHKCKRIFGKILDMLMGV